MLRVTTAVQFVRVNGQREGRGVGGGAHGNAGGS